MRLRLILCAAIAVSAFACGGSDDDDGNNPPVGDADGDGISDDDEGRATNVDTDGDGIPDWQDEDSDNDGIPDYREAGDTDPGTRPVDTDNDGVPDFRDLDADGNGIPDELEGTGDPDGDGLGNWQDLDDDGDFIGDTHEIGPDPQNPIDTDGDGIPDFIDRDSDDDGIADAVEDTNCNGIRDGNETDAGNADTDGDGVSDLIEEAAGTDPNNPADNPQANGDFVFIVPYQEPPSPMDDDLDFATRLQQLDMYVLIDRSGSMSTEFTAIRNNLGTVIRNLTCPPLGTGDPNTCIPDLWAGAGTIGYSGSTGGNAYLHAVDLQPNPNVSGLPATEPNGCCAEPLTFGVYAAITGLGTASVSSCGIQTVAPRSTCNGSPAANAGFSPFGYPCFRSNSLPVILLATDEVPLSAGDTNKCPNWSSVVLPQMTARSAKLVGILGDGAAAAVTTDLRQMATDTGAVDSTNNQPLVFNGSGSTAATAIENGIRTLANNIALDMAAVASDDPSDAVNAVQAFVSRLETLQLGTPQCASGLNDVDTDGDTFDDAFLDVRAGTPVCWKLIAKTNTTVPATTEPQLFRATVNVLGDGVTVLDTRDVFFLVPPRPLDEPIN